MFKKGLIKISFMKILITYDKNEIFDYIWGKYTECWLCFRWDKVKKIIIKVKEIDKNKDLLFYRHGNTKVGNKLLLDGLRILKDLLRLMKTEVSTKWVS